jgi:DNA-binding XRE family transcriptional regulator
MSTDFKDFVEEVEAGASPEERAELDRAREQFSIGAKLLQHRLSAGMTQSDLAKASGVDQADISRIERGQGNPTAQTLDALAAPLGVALSFVPAAALTP